MGSTTSTSAWVFGLAGLIVGGLVTWGFASTMEEPTSSLNSEGDLQELRMAVIALGDRIEEIGVQRRATVPSATNGSKEEFAPAPLSPELRRRLDEMEAMMKSLADALSQAVEVKGKSQDAIPQLVMPERAIDPAILENLTEQSEIDNDLNHFGWTYQKVLDVYGKPNRSHPSPSGGGHKWYYDLFNGGEIVFWFIDNHVVRAMAAKD